MCCLSPQEFHLWQVGHTPLIFSLLPYFLNGHWGGGERPKLPNKWRLRIPTLDTHWQGWSVSEWVWLFDLQLYRFNKSDSWILSSQSAGESARLLKGKHTAKEWTERGKPCRQEQSKSNAEILELVLHLEPPGDEATVSASKGLIWIQFLHWFQMKGINTSEINKTIQVCFRSTNWVELPLGNSPRETWTERFLPVETR